MAVNLSIILPTYKEKENLAVLIPQIEEEFKGGSFEIIIVDDHSCDGTSQLVATLNETYHNVSLLERPGLLGIGSALRDGYNKAQGEYILSSDADLSFTTEDMRSLYEKICSGYDMVLGYKISRKREENAEIQRTFHGWIEEYVTSPLSNGIIRLMSGIKLKNYNTDFRIIRASTWKSIQTVEDRQFFLFETIYRATQAGACITELPVTFSPRTFGESKVNFFKQAPKYLLKLLHLVFLNQHS
ncbi:MAG: glycosyltransferase [Candidatus Roizmanbacteria bacterium]|nr:glycosyltransferase [Candidatus Roizmanbacteria bacterium]